MCSFIKPASFFYCFIGLILCSSVHAQGNTSKTITPYQTIYSDARGTVQIRFLLFPCSNDLSSRAYGFYNTISDKGGYVSGKFDYVECDGKNGTQKFDVSLNRTGEIKDAGDWFGSKPYKIVRIYDVRSWGGSFGNGSSANSGNTGTGSYSTGGNNGSGSYSPSGNGSGSYWNSGRSGSKAYNNGNDGSGSNSYSNSGRSGSNSYSNNTGGNTGTEQQNTTAITLFANGGFTGATKNISGDWSVSGMGDSWNDAISSIAIPTGWRVTVYRDSNFQGRSMVLTGNWSVSGQFDEWNDQISSIRVTRQ
jgi:hypothetical protein